MGSGKRFEKTSGIASGSYFTQLIRSICNCIIIYYASIKLYRSLPFEDIYMGDNSFLGVTQEWNLIEVSKLVEETFGMHVNIEKSQVSFH